ncbi:MAG: GGDEF domain-containing protein [Stagnimonas sp.]|nr:GGDEF domain-containing protein [Stagnimonas sp.]
MDSIASNGGAPLEEAARMRFNRLRFAPADERAFRSDHEAEAMPARVALTLLALILIGLTPLYDTALLHMPESLLVPTRSLQFGFQIPALVPALLCCLLPSLRPWSAVTITVATLAVAAGLEAQRILGAAQGFHVPHDFVVVTLSATLLLGGLRLFYFLPWALLAMLLGTVVEVWNFESEPAVMYDCISAWMLFLLALAGAWFREAAERRSWSRQRQLEHQARHDWLTGLPNRRDFEAQFQQLAALAVRDGCPLSLLLLDIDGFKPYNDRYGNPAGDEVLRRVAGELQRQAGGAGAFCARVGGEEFAVVLLDFSAPEALQLSESWRASVGALGIPHETMLRGGVVSASAGFAHLDAAAALGDPELLVSSLVRRADIALCEAKAAGRDRLVRAE